MFLWTFLFVLYIAATGYVMNWRGDLDFTVWRSRPLFDSACRIIGVVILGPILEEVLFRGVLFYLLCKLIRNVWVTMPLLALLWAGLHIGYSYEVDLLIFGEGLILGAALIKSRSLYLPVILHMISNLYAIW